MKALTPYTTLVHRCTMRSRQLGTDLTRKTFLGIPKTTLKLPFIIYFPLSCLPTNVLHLGLTQCVQSTPCGEHQHLRFTVTGALELLDSHGQCLPNDIIIDAPNIFAPGTMDQNDWPYFPRLTPNTSPPPPRPTSPMPRTSVDWHMSASTAPHPSIPELAGRNPSTVTPTRRPS